jgi:dTDP-glucose 4,6-dehydratase
MAPSTPYAASKAAGDLFVFTLVKQYGFPMVMIRSTNVYGKYQQLYRIIPRTAIYLKLGKKVPLQGGGKAIKSYIHIKDVCEGILAALRKGRDGEIYHFSPDDSISIHDLVKKVCESMGYDFARSVEPVGERVGQDSRYVIDSSKARKELGWAPKISFEEGIREVVEWVQDNYELIIKEPLDYVHIPS